MNELMIHDTIQDWQGFYQTHDFNFASQSKPRGVAIACLYSSFIDDRTKVSFCIDALKQLTHFIKN